MKTSIGNSEGFTGDIWRMCGEDKGGCICGQIWSTKMDFNVATVHMENEDIGSITKDQMLSNAQRIVTAVNNFDAMYAALKDMVENFSPTIDGRNEIKQDEILAKAKAIINTIDNK